MTESHVPTSRMRVGINGRHIHPEGITDTEHCAECRRAMTEDRVPNPCHRCEGRGWIDNSTDYRDPDGRPDCSCCGGTGVERIKSAEQPAPPIDHNHEKCNGCLYIGHLPHDASTCADFDTDGDHCVIEHAPFDDGPVGYPQPAPPLDVERLARAMHRNFTAICDKHSMEACPYARSRIHSTDFIERAATVAAHYARLGSAPSEPGGEE